MKNLFIHLFIFFIYSASFAQYDVTHIEYKKNIDSDIWETNDGYLWFFSEGQLCRFDGDEFEYFNYKDDFRAFKGGIRNNLFKIDGGIIFEYIGFIYKFKNGKFTKLNPVEIYKRTGGWRDRKIDKYGQFYYNNVLYKINEDELLIDSIGNKANYKERYINFNLNNNNSYSIYNESYYYQIDSLSRVDSTKLDLYTIGPYNLQYNDFVINRYTILFYATFSDTAYLVENGRIIKKYNTSGNYVDDYGYGANDGTDGLPKFWTNGEQFLLYANNFVIQKDTVIKWNIDNKYIPIECISNNQMIFKNNNFLFIKDFSNNQIKYISEIEDETDNNIYILENNKIILKGGNGLIVLTTGSYDKTNNNLQFYHFFKDIKVFLGEYIDENGEVYGRGIKSKGQKNYYVLNSEMNSYVQQSGVFKNINNILHLDNLKAKNGDNYLVTAEVDTISEKLSKYTVSCNGESFSSNEFNKKMKFFIINDSLKGFNYDSQKWFTVNIKQKTISTAHNYKVKGKKILVSNSTILSLEGNAYSNKKKDSTKLTWQLLNTDMKYDSLYLILENYPQIYMFNNDEIAVLNSGESHTITKVKLSTKEVVKVNTGVNIIEKNGTNSGRKHGCTDLQNGLWMISEKGIVLINNLNTVQEFGVQELKFKECLKLQVVQDSLLLVLTEDELFYININEFYQKGNKKINSILKFDSGIYDVIDELDSGEIYISARGYGNIIKLPPNFLDIQFVEPPKLVLKSFQHDSIFEFGEYPEFKIVQPEELKSKFKFDKNNFAFKFSAQEFRNNEYLSYRYKVDGLFENWEYTSVPEVKLKSLDHGTYTLIFQSIYQDEFSEPFEYTFTILPPWYHTWWARTLYALAGLLIVFTFIRSRTAKLQKRQAELEKEVELATEEIKEQKVEVEQQRDNAKNEHKKAEELRHVAELQKEIVEEKNKEILDSITYAKRIQNAILPPPRLVKEWLNDSFIYYKPKDIVAGDFYWMEVVKKDGKSLIFYAAADCTGHGVPGAMVSVVCSNALNRSIKEFNITDPAQLLDKVTELVKDSFEQSEEAIKDGMDIAICALDLVDKKVWFAGAHNPLYRITNLDTKVPDDLRILEVDNRKLVEYKADKQPVGDFEYLKPFTTTEIQLEPGDCVYIFSDGFADQFGGEKNKKYKSANFKKFLMQIESKDMGAQKDILNDEIDRWRGEIEQLDDICVIGVRINGEMRKIFTIQELEIIKKIVQGKQSKEIAEELNIAKSTVDTHRKRILTKSNTHSAIELIKFCKLYEVI